MSSVLKELVTKHAMDSKDPLIIFDLAKEYDNLGQGAMAVSLYIKAGDLTDDDLLQYKCAIRAAKCYGRQGRRWITVKSLLKRAIRLFPARPEAYYWLCQYNAHETYSFIECSIFAKIALLHQDDWDGEDLDLGFESYDYFKYFDTYSSWRIHGLHRTKEEMFDLLYRNKVTNQKVKDMIWDFLCNTGVPEGIKYLKEDYNRWKFKFSGQEIIERNYAKHFQDMFVLSVLDGKRNGTYLELGSGLPTHANNTALLEKEFGWKGLSVEIDPALCYEFRLNRNNPVVNQDTRFVNFSDLLDSHTMPRNIDYLSLDVDDSTIETLENIPFDKYKFGVITFEHDAYRYKDEGATMRSRSREIFQSQDYVLVVPNMSMWFRDGEVEDWWVHKSYLTDRILKQMKSNLDRVFVWNYFYDN